MPKKTPMCQCVGCREMKPKQELIRVVKTRTGRLSVSPGGLFETGPEIQGAGAGLLAHPPAPGF